MADCSKKQRISQFIEEEKSFRPSSKRTKDDTNERILGEKLIE